ncbi:tetratricopeptide repeat protein [Arenimonas sp. MALMAid1274]|uniref:tetratricopeptide repeat protein n=1 Tax=Arenimonas sp. MALMAid1274 TaxID=3411630 RepID=UPI003B9FBAB3
MRKFFPAVLVGLALLAAGGQAAAQITDRDDRRIITTEGFLTAHPDLRYRLEGLDAYEKGKHAEALGLFTRAAKYADKPSQSMLGEMHWKGLGVPVDRAMAYVWMDLAAERGYPLMVAKRESYWRDLDEAERARALSHGDKMYGEYGDDVAKARMRLMLRRERLWGTGSRVGSTGNLRIMIPTASGVRYVSGDDYYDRKFWQPDLYFQWQDQDWKRTGKATVEVGEVQTRLTEDEAGAGSDDEP